MMRYFATKKCRAVTFAGTLLIFGGMTRNLNAQEAQAQTNGRAEMAQFDSFLDAHSDIDAQLRANPSLLNNAEYLEAHPQLQSFLSQHPQVQTQVGQNPSVLMEREKRFDANEARRSATPNPDLTRRQVGTMDQFLDKNPNIDKDLQRNPGLVNNAQYLQQHPELQAFLNQHPNVKEEISENPRYFMQRENRFDSQERGSRGTNPNPDLTRQQVAALDQFLDSHRDIDQTLDKNPWLIRNAQYLKEHPELQTFLNQHPELKEESAETPKYLMQREQRFDARESSPRGANPNPDLTRQQVAALDQFLDSHPDVDRTLDKNPWLIRNAQYLKEHPELQTFLNQHPELKEESAETPKYLMQREQRFDAREQGRQDRDFDRDRGANAQNDRDRDVNRDRDANGDRDASRDRDANAQNDRDRDASRDRDANAQNDRDRDVNRDRDTDRTGRDTDRRRTSDTDVNNREVASMDDFLDRHQDVAKSLEKKPGLINDQSYLKRHKDLSEFLSEHPAVREEVRENPSYFMRRENQFEARNMDRDPVDRDRSARDRDDRTADRDRDRGARVADNDLNKKELQDMDHFLDKHKKIEKDLQKNPALANDNDYLKHHKSLEAFLSKNPKVGEELRENPSTFMQHQQRLEQHRMNNHAPAAKPKTKIEEKEQTHTATPH